MGFVLPAGNSSASNLGAPANLLPSILRLQSQTRFQGGSVSKIRQWFTTSAWIWLHPGSSSTLSTSSHIQSEELFKWGPDSKWSSLEVNLLSWQRISWENKVELLILSISHRRQSFSFFSANFLPKLLIHPSQLLFPFLLLPQSRARPLLMLERYGYGETLKVSVCLQQIREGQRGLFIHVHGHETVI